MRLRVTLTPTLTLTLPLPLPLGRTRGGEHAELLPLDLGALGVPRLHAGARALEDGDGRGVLALGLLGHRLARLVAELGLGLG